MTEDQITNVYELTPQGQPDSMVILLHGLGSNGQDLISLAPHWTSMLPHTVFLSPDAPFACDMVPPGYPNSFQWFSLQDRDPHKMLEGVKNAAPILQSFIEAQLQKYSVAPERVVLCGFSQGAMMSLYTGPRLPEKIAGILGYSGAMIGEAGPQQIPVHLIHGEVDDVVPVEAHAHAKQMLEAENFTVTGHTTPGLSHSIDEKGLISGGEFVKFVLP